MSTAKNTLKIMDAFLSNGGKLTLSEAIQLSGLSRGIVYRVFLTMQESNYIRRGKIRGSYLLGIKFLNLARQARDSFSIEDIILPYLKKVNENIDEFVFADVLDGEKVNSIIHLESKQHLRVVGDKNLGRPMHCTASGKVFLAFMSSEEIDNYFTKNKILQSFTNKTITQRDDLTQQLSTIRRDGFSINQEEFTIGVTAVACPVRNFQGKIVACIGAAIPTARVTNRRLNELIRLIKDTASAISL